MMQPANPNLLPVSEADRVRAGKMWADVHPDSSPYDWQAEWMTSGTADAGPVVQAFAAHRLAAEQSVRETWQAGTGAAIDTLASELAVRQQAMAEGRVGS